MIGIECIIDFTGLEKKEFAEQLGVSKQQLNSWVNGSRKIPKKWLDVLSEKYQLPHEIFMADLNHEEEMKLYRHFLQHQKVGGEELDRRVNVVSESKHRFDLHTNNVERLYVLLKIVHERETEKYSDFSIDEIEGIIDIEDKFISATDKFLSIIEEGDIDKISKLYQFINDLS